MELVSSIVKLAPSRDRCVDVHRQRPDAALVTAQYKVGIDGSFSALNAIRPNCWRSG